MGGTEFQYQLEGPLSRYEFDESYDYNMIMLVLFLDGNMGTKRKTILSKIGNGYLFILAKNSNSRDEMNSNVRV